ncbi:nucleotidyltransferase domain-containing protein [Methylomagnum sp.]
MSIQDPPISILTRQIVALVHPLRIILFGSQARGEAGQDSDIDLLVVMPEGTHRRETARFLYQHIEGIKTPFDLIVATPRDLERYRDNIGLVYKNALRDGQDLYAA